MFNRIENVLTKYENVVLDCSSFKFTSSRGKWISQSPGPGHVLQNLSGVQVVNMCLDSLVFYSSSNKEHLHDNDL